MGCLGFYSLLAAEANWSKKSLDFITHTAA